MSCPRCGSKTARLNLVRRGRDTAPESLAVVACQKCDLNYSISCEGACPWLEAFCDLITEDSGPFSLDALTIPDICISTAWDKCLYLSNDSCPRALALMHAAKQGHIHPDRVPEWVSFESRLSPPPELR